MTTTAVPVARSTQELAQDRTDMATARTVMAADRTLMSWLRTSLSMLSFGFTIYKVLQGFQAAGKALPNEHTPRNVGLFLIGMGTMAMVMGTIDYLATLKDVRRFKEFSLRRPSLIMALIMALTGVVLFTGILINVF